MRKLIAAALVACIPAVVHAQFSQSSYVATAVFRNLLASNAPTMAYDGTYYWTNGDNTNRGQMGQYDGSGNLVNTYRPAIDIRSLFSDASGNIFARGCNNSTIYQMTAPGSFTPLVTLAGPLDCQPMVVLNGAGTGYVALDDGEVREWDLSGASAGSVALNGYGSLSNESDYSIYRGFSAVGSVWLTYADNATLSMWDQAGNRLGTAVLVGAGNTPTSDLSASYANGMEFIADVDGSSWRGYDIGLGGAESSTPEPGSLALLATGLVGVVGVGMHRRKAKTA
jgi:hypothetical protein